MSAALKALVERLEAGETGREIDRDIDFYTFPKALKGAVWENDEWRLPDGESACCEPYTTSIDAKLPWEEGLLWRIHKLDIDGRVVWYVEVVGTSITAEAPTEAAARRAAALKAREARL